jgi:hypothetical protein
MIANGDENTKAPPFKPRVGLFQKRAGKIRYGFKRGCGRTRSQGYTAARSGFLPVRDWHTRESTPSF